VQIAGTGGNLSDHYDPRNKTLFLSQNVANVPSVASVAVAAHELGHAMQDYEGYLPLRFRAALVPMVNIGTNLGWIMILAGMLLQLTNLAWLGVAFFSGGAIFALATLPVELNASGRAKRLLAETGIIAGEDEQRGVNSVLNAAALTYVAGAITAMLQLLYYVMLIGGIGDSRPPAGFRLREFFCVYNDSNMRKFILVVGLFLGVALVILSFSELQTILETLKRANLWFVLLALALQGAWFLVVGRMYRSVYHLLGMDDSALHLTMIAAAATFVNTVTASAGIGGIALFTSQARRRGHPSGKTTVAAALCLILDQAAFLIVLTLGMVVLIRRNNVGAGEITATLVLLAFASVNAFLLYLGYRSATRLGRVLAGAARLINRVTRPVFHRNYLSEDRAHEFAQDIAEGISGLTEQQSSLLRPIGYGLIGKALLMGILTCSFLAFSVPFSPGTIVGGFSIGYLFLLVSPTPSGIGVVEGVLSLALASLRVLWSEAVIITLVYRAITFWVPLGIGALAFRRLH
jgi:uncharacterized protein (TIRG00374 family)